MPKFTASLNVPQYASTPSSAQNGDVYYNTTTHTFYARINGTWTDLAATGGGGGTPGIAESVRAAVRNVTGSTISKGSVVYLNGVNGQKPTIAKAIATGDSSSAETIGWVEDDITNNSDGYVTTFGILNNVNTNGFTDGAYLYLSGTTAGAYTATKPYAPIHNVTVGFVVKGGSVGAGQVFVLIKNGFELDELHDVATHDFPPNDNESLTFDDASDLWKPAKKSAVYYQATAPASPKDGDIWVESDNDITTNIIPTASTSTAGIVQLTDSVSSSSTTTAATANSVKTVSDSAEFLAYIFFD